MYSSILFRYELLLFVVASFIAQEMIIEINHVCVHQMQVPQPGRERIWNCLSKHWRKPSRSVLATVLPKKTQKLRLYLKRKRKMLLFAKRAPWHLPLPKGSRAPDQPRSLPGLPEHNQFILVHSGPLHYCKIITVDFAQSQRIENPAGILQPRKTQQIFSFTPGQLHNSALNAKEKVTKGKVLSGNDLGNAATVSRSAPNNTARVLGPVEHGRPSLPQQNRCICTPR